MNWMRLREAMADLGIPGSEDKMFAKKEKEESLKPTVIRAKDIGIPYTELTVKIIYTLANNHEYNHYKTLYLLDYASCPTAKEAMRAFYDKFLDIQNEYREQIIKNFGKYEGYMNFDGLFVRNDQCTMIYIETSDNSGSVRNGYEETPDVNGWPWKVGSYHAK